MSELLRATIALQEDSIQMQEKENERLHTLHLQRTKLTTKVIKERDEAQDEVERLTDSADKLAETLEALVRFRVRPWFLVLGNCGNGTNSLAIDDAQAVLKEYKS